MADLPRGFPWIGLRDLPVSTSATPAGWFTIDQAAQHFAVSRATAYRRIAAGDWPTSRLPGMAHTRLSPEDIAEIEARAERIGIAA